MESSYVGIVTVRETTSRYERLPVATVEQGSVAHEYQRLLDLIEEEERELERARKERERLRKATRRAQEALDRAKARLREAASSPAQASSS